MKFILAIDKSVLLSNKSNIVYIYKHGFSQVLKYKRTNAVLGVESITEANIHCQISEELLFDSVIVCNAARVIFESFVA